MTKGYSDRRYVFFYYECAQRMSDIVIWSWRRWQIHFVFNTIFFSAGNGSALLKKSAVVRLLRLLLLLRGSIYIFYSWSQKKLSDFVLCGVSKMVPTFSWELLGRKGVLLSILLSYFKAFMWHVRDGSTRSANKKYRNDKKKISANIFRLTSELYVFTHHNNLWANQETYILPFFVYLLF